MMTMAPSGENGKDARKETKGVRENEEEIVIAGRCMPGYDVLVPSLCRRNA
jgi:hypothetical protein